MAGVALAKELDVSRQVIVQDIACLLYTSFVNRKMAGYGLDECDAAKEVQKAKKPILFIHGDKDTFVPCSMCDELYAKDVYKRQLLRWKQTSSVL